MPQSQVRHGAGPCSSAFAPNSPGVAPRARSQALARAILPHAMAGRTGMGSTAWSLGLHASQATSLTGCRNATAPQLFGYWSSEGNWPRPPTQEKEFQLPPRNTACFAIAAATRPRLACCDVARESASVVPKPLQARREEQRLAEQPWCVAASHERGRRLPTTSWTCDKERPHAGCDVSSRFYAHSPASHRV